jgi:hypothetical protein
MSMINRPHYIIGVMVRGEISYLAKNTIGGNYLTNYKTMAEKYPSRKAAVVEFRTFCGTRDVIADFYSQYIVVGRNVLCE